MYRCLWLYQTFFQPINFVSFRGDLFTYSFWLSDIFWCFSVQQKSGNQTHLWTNWSAHPHLVCQSFSDQNHLGDGYQPAPVLPGKKTKQSRFLCLWRISAVHDTDHFTVCYITFYNFSVQIRVNKEFGGTGYGSHRAWRSESDPTGRQSHEEWLYNSQ